MEWVEFNDWDNQGLEVGKEYLITSRNVVYVATYFESDDRGYFNGYPYTVAFMNKPEPFVSCN